MQDLEFSPKVRGVEELHETTLSLGQLAGVGPQRGLKIRCGMMHEKGLLRLEAGRGKAAALQGGGDPVPADMAGQVLLAGPRQQIV